MKLDLMSEIQTGVAATGAAKAVERPAAGNAAGGGRSVGKSSSAGASSSASGVTVTLSSQLSVDSSAGDVVDTSKVQAMKDAIASGSFQVNAEAIADKLLSNAREMLTASRR